jgi:hypothetical protein
MRPIAAPLTWDRAAGSAGPLASVSAGRGTAAGVAAAGTVGTTPGGGEARTGSTAGPHRSPVIAPTASRKSATCW